MNTEDTVSLASIRTVAPGAAPVTLKLAEIGGIGQAVNSFVSWNRSRCAISPGVLTETLVAALLCGSRPLYHVGCLLQDRRGQSCKAKIPRALLQNRRGQRGLLVQNTQYCHWPTAVTLHALPVATGSQKWSTSALRHQSSDTLEDVQKFLRFRKG